MPWLSEAKKDVISCEKLRRAANALRPANIRMGEPVTARPLHTDIVSQRGELKHLSSRRKRK